MFDLERMFENIGAQLAPHAEKFRTTADMRVCQILAYLDTIARNTESQEFDERIMPGYQWLTADDAKDMFYVPAGTEWVLETVGALAPCTITITDDGSYVYVHQFDSPDTDTPGIRLRGGARLQIVSSGNDEQVKVFTQVRIKEPRRSSPAVGAGQFQQLPTVKHDESTGRHVTDGLMGGGRING